MLKVNRIVIVDVISPFQKTENAGQNLEELKALISTYHGIHIVDVIQHRTRPDKATFIGSGKVAELVEIVKKQKIDVVVINAIIKPSVLFNLTQYLWNDNPDIQVWDRVDLILNIFDKHAHTREAKLQIELARMYHMGPRIYGLGLTYFSRQSGGIGTKGQGETNIELMKRHWRDQIKIKKDELKKLSTQHQLQIERRKSNHVQSVSIVGYTNAGKTSLFNYLTKRKKIVENALFVTLDSVTGKLYLPGLKKEVTISDTIGFIKDLPTSLIESFKSTLLESINADLILHVVDITDPEMEQKIQVVMQILKEIGAHSKKIIYVFNKIDAYSGDGKALLKKINDIYAPYFPQYISITTDYGIDKLLAQIDVNFQNTSFVI